MDRRDAKHNPVSRREPSVSPPRLILRGRDYPSKHEPSEFGLGLRPFPMLGGNGKPVWLGGDLCLRVNVGLRQSPSRLPSPDLSRSSHHDLNCPSSGRYELSRPADARHGIIPAFRLSESCLKPSATRFRASGLTVGSGNAWRDAICWRRKV